MEDSFSPDRGGGGGCNMSDGSGSNASEREQWGAAGEALLTHPLLTSCCAAWFLTGSGPGVEDPWSREPQNIFIAETVFLS